MFDSSKLSIVSGRVFDECYSLDNYLIEEDGVENDTCAIYISSSGIYYPNTEECLRKSILEKDFFEWYSIRFYKASKHIFIRDVAKQFYITGINRRIDTIDKLIEWLREQTKGYKTYIVGSSAGGYLAALLGSVLNSEWILCFSGYFDLNIIDKSVWFYIDQYAADVVYSKWYSISSNIRNYTGLMIYFYPNKLAADVKQSECIKDYRNIISIPISSTIHGIPITKKLLQDIMRHTPQEIEDKLVTIEAFANKSSLQVNIIVYGLIRGSFDFFMEQFKSLYKRIKNKLLSIVK